MANKNDVHPVLSDFLEQVCRKELSRRGFLRYASLLGMSVAGASALVGLPLARQVSAADSVQKGGILKISSPVQKVTHPAQFSWVAPSNQLRQVAEYLTYTDGNNITHPYLLKDWVASDDLKTWTLNLREKVFFNNGDAFTADDVVFSMNQWLDKSVGSSLLGMIGDYLSPTGIEKTSKYQVKLHLNRPEIAVPEQLFHYPALILNHKTFEGDFVKRPHGTGPYMLAEYREGERCVLKRREDYWQKDLPYLDGMAFLDMGSEMAPQIAAIKSGEIDVIDMSDAGGIDVYLALKDDPNISILSSATGQARVLRMRADKKPWSDNRVRMALKLCQHREKILALAYHEQGLMGSDTHVSPIHPEYCKKDIPQYDPQKAKKLLVDAGYPNGLTVDLAVGADWSDAVRYAEILKQDALPAGFNINIKMMPTSQYWEKWTEVDLGITPWTHRPLGTMVLNLAYVGDKEKNPVPWNETHWMDDEFSSLLKEANGTLDVDERRKIFCRLEDIQMQRGSVGIAYWRSVWTITRKRVQNAKPHPTLYMLFNEVWVGDGK